jgi:putative beta-lysine N-acetyltransferase
MNDHIEKIGASIIQHGKHNDRVYLMKLVEKDFPGIITILDEMCCRNNYSKIIGKVPVHYSRGFLENGYTIEADVPGFYGGSELGLFVAKYFSEARKKTSQSEILEMPSMAQTNGVPTKAWLDNRFRFQRLETKDVEQMALIYQSVFQSYPFPIHRPGYLRQTMGENVNYFGIWEQDKLIALASSEMDPDSLNAEMTDFAVLPEYRGNHFALFLLKEMELEMKIRGIKTAYTIARLKSAGMNRTFYKAGYQYRGTLVNNCHISGSFESMNVWSKTL